MDNKNEWFYGWMLDLIKQKEKEEQEFKQIELELPLPNQEKPIDKVKNEEEKTERGVIIIDI